jgi:hypothetical protein
MHAEIPPVLLPLKAVVLDLISLGAACGIIVFIFQWGHGSETIWGARDGRGHLLDPVDDLRVPVVPSLVTLFGAGTGGCRSRSPACCGCR